MGGDAADASAGALDELWRTLPLYPDLGIGSDVLAARLFAETPTALLAVDLPEHRDSQQVALRGPWAREVERLRALLPPDSAPLMIASNYVHVLVPEADEETLLALLERTRKVGGSSVGLIVDTDMADARHKLYVLRWTTEKDAPWRAGLSPLTRASDWGRSGAWLSLSGLVRLNPSWFKQVPVPMVTVRLTGRFGDYLAEERRLSEPNSHGPAAYLHRHFGHPKHKLLYPRSVVPFEINDERFGFLYPGRTRQDAVTHAERLRQAVAWSDWSIETHQGYLAFRCEPGEITADVEIDSPTSVADAQKLLAEIL
jgi:hypothetical protein